jgi:hypothetical protein
MPVRALPFLGRMVLKFSFTLRAKLIAKLSAWLKSKFRRRWELHLNPTNQVKEIYGRRNSQKELLAFKGGEAPQHQTPISN